MALRFLSQKVAQAVDEELMSVQGGFSIDQLMELAGLSVAQAVQKSFDVSSHQRILVCVGPGNNGGDGLVAARHLSHFGYKPALYYPKQPNKDLYRRLLRQCENLGTTMVENDQLEQHMDQTDVIVDAIFGFSFHGDVRDPFKQVIRAFQYTKKPIVSVDIPSGWDVMMGPTEQAAFQPHVLVSLTAPKECASHFRGQHHFLGGRFVSPALAEKFQFDIPNYHQADQVVEI
ncbi:YjeF N-terminal domain-containing protein [Halteromyces radiatus]|uniref:YjeF N-terminal domain-containing protein n=1 Tax=Halteromyces radiatus TaxID=101107 RepID=UPI00221FA6E4|nr:YjeF N-terminal domain-containing protein [Halteromyces radiatus]KAI8098460.1 YjeF N-terminal domain-containing protein [Halteromyces radiatus]